MDSLEPHQHTFITIVIDTQLFMTVLGLTILTFQ